MSFRNCKATFAYYEDGIMSISKTTVVEKLEQLIKSYIDETEFSLSDDIMGKPLFLSAHELASFFLEIEETFSVDLNKLLPNLDMFSLDSIAELIVTLCDECKMAKHFVQTNTSKAIDV